MGKVGAEVCCCQGPSRSERMRLRCSEKIRKRRRKGKNKKGWKCITKEEPPISRLRKHH